MYFKLKSVLCAAIALPALVRSSPAALGPRNPRTLRKRALVGVACGGFSSATSGDTQNNLNNLGVKDINATAAATSCSRVGCYNTSGVYLCNDQDVDITIALSDVVEAADLIANTCEGGDGFSGQFFYDDDGGYNVVVGFCDGNEPSDTPPSAYTPPGPNGSGTQYCGGNDQDPCSLGDCDKDTLVIESQESVTCSEFLAPSYCGAGETITYSTSRTVTEAWTVGGWIGLTSGDLGKAATGQLGFSASFTKSVGTGDISGVSADCGDTDGSNGARGNWTCAMEVDPKCYLMTGTCHTYYTYPTGSTTDLGVVPWGVISPQVADDSQGIKALNLCTCKNCAGWGDGGAPNLYCDLDCDTCDTPDGGV